MDTVKHLFDFIKASPTAIHAVNTVAEALLCAGYSELYETEEWSLTVGHGYFVKRGGTSLIAFRYNGKELPFNIVASHSDSPTFRVKAVAETLGAYTRLNVERYGGSIYYTWFDRPLGIAGRAVVRTECGLEARAFDLGATAVIPSLAPHLNREVNSSFAPNPANDLLPLYSISDNAIPFIHKLAGSVDVSPEQIVSYDAFLYNAEQGRVIGDSSELLLCPRFDDLGCVFASLKAFLSAKETSLTPVLAIFDNEEVGSETKQGAASTLLQDTLVRISGTEAEYRRLLPSSFMVSADNAHAVHPAHPELSDPHCSVRLGKGVAVKYNASQRYTTDGISDAIFRTVAERRGVTLQRYTNRADMPGGSTLGSIATTRVSVPTVDIGLPQLAMHSAMECAAVSDLEDMISVLTELYSTPISVKGGKIEI